MSERIAAYQLSLLGDPPKPGRAYTVPIYGWRWAGLTFPLPDGAARQIQMLTVESRGRAPAGSEQ